MLLKRAVMTVLVLGFLVTAGCEKLNELSSLSDAAGGAEQIGDTFASIDEAGGSGGSLALLESHKKSFAHFVPNSSEKELFIRNIILPSAQATSCQSASTWGSCDQNVITRNFNNCTLGGATFSGNVKLTYTDGAVNNVCSISAMNDKVERVPAFTIEGAKGGSYTVSKTGTYGQRITKTGAGAYSFENDGIQRVVKFNGVTLFDSTTTTVSPLVISGQDRNGRVISSGKLRVTNNSTGVVCDYTPSSVTWGSSCNCPISGSVSGTCTNGKSVSLRIVGCGLASVTFGDKTEDVSMDRCSSL